ncbi:Protein of unknown function [Cotesia congregata]|uniref:Uncharacterized protein n=1 Tax=Cotesia congregata TaxID=51543 RepID=A0A8J2HPA6_COTCN|nr:Protein of unknown function [Cotesia congregata]
MEDYKRFYEESFKIEIEDNPGLADNSDSDYDDDDDDDDDMVTVVDGSDLDIDISNDRSHLDNVKRKLQDDFENEQLITLQG